MGDFLHQLLGPLLDAVFQVFVEDPQLLLHPEKVPILLHGGFIGGNQDVQNPLPAGRNGIFLAADQDFDFFGGVAVFYPGLLALCDKVLDAGQKVLFIVGFGNEIVGAAFEAANDIPGVRKDREQNDRRCIHGGIRFDPLAQFEAVHFRHDDVADNDRGLVGADQCKRLLTVAGVKNMVSLLFQGVSQSLGLGQAVFHDDDVVVHFSGVCPVMLGRYAAIPLEVGVTAAFSLKHSGGILSRKNFRRSSKRCSR